MREEYHMSNMHEFTATFGYPMGGIVVPENKLGLMAPWRG
jgi:hypothetical protein